jgi:hypothetical protein
MMATTLDWKKDLKHLYNAPSKAPVEVDVPPMNFLMIDGRGDPNTAESYKQAVEALYSLSYTLKFAAKKSASPVEYAVMPLEGLWWVDDLSSNVYASKDQWYWTMMIGQPDVISDEMIERAKAEVQRKKGLTNLDQVRLQSLHEGHCAQIMHIGPYSAEKPTIDRLHAYIADDGFAISGKHHEIYLKDARKTAPDKLKTVIRYPVQRATIK